MAAPGPAASTLATSAAAVPRAARAGEGWLPHAVLLTAIAVIAFPLYYALVISTQTLGEASSLPPRLWPSTAALDNYAEAWRRAGMGRLLFNSAVMALAVAVGKIVISLLSAFAIVYFN
ncbi:MAG TPA: hypothetical protein VFX28_02450, partial [Methylomirabilota bacterium]|nr:hypothetical protein [Methylomirabilota bacterium]